jgi:hypothetical protein
MTEIVSLDSLLQGINIVYIYGHTFLKAVDKLVETSSQAVCYTLYLSFIINDLGVLETNSKGQRFFDIELKKVDGDIVTHIDISMYSELIMGQNTFSSLNRVVSCNSFYHDNKIRVYVDDQERVYISYNVIVLCQELREKIVSTPLLVCDNIMYSGSVSIPIQ